MRNMFRCCYSLAYLDMSSFDTSKVTSGSEFLYNCTKLAKLRLGEKFSWNSGTISTPPKPSKYQISGANGKWYNSAGKALTSLPSNVADTYYASKALAAAGG